MSGRPPAAAGLTGLPRLGPGPPGRAASRGASGAAHRPGPVFPGGGRLLFADAHRLKWVYPDGRVVQIATGFSRAAVPGSELVAWNRTGVYTMALDGSRRHLALPFAPGSAAAVPQAGALSPGGSRFACYAGNQLSAADLATGHRIRLGRVSFDGWRNDTSVLASATDGSAVLLVNAATGNRPACLTITDAALVRAYQKAAPGAGPPAGMTGEGFSGTGTSAALAVTLAAAGPLGGSRPVEVILAGAGRPVTYAPATPQQFEFSWGPGGLQPARHGGRAAGQQRGDLPAHPAARLPEHHRLPEQGKAHHLGTVESRRASLQPAPPPAKGGLARSNKRGFPRFRSLIRGQLSSN